jgi:hypothetical protein
VLRAIEKVPQMLNNQGDEGISALGPTYPQQLDHQRQAQPAE